MFYSERFLQGRTLIKHREIVMKLLKRNARIAGLLYLFLIVFAFFPGFVSANLIVKGDAIETAHNIMASQSLFRIGFVSDLLHMTCYLLLAWALYVLLNPISRNIALLFILCVSVSVAVQSVNLLINFSALQFLSQAEYFEVFDGDQINAQMVLLNLMMENGILVAQIFFGLWLLPLGYLVYRSGYFPRILGALLMIGCFGLLTESFQHFLFPKYGVISYPGLVIGGIAEITFCFWLLFKGVNNPVIDTEETK